MKEIGQLLEIDGRYEFRVPEMSLIVRGDHPEWVMEAACEVVSSTAKMASEGEIEELETLVEFEEATEIEVDSAKFNHQQRFDIIPQCIVTMGRLDYKWVAPSGREKLGDEFDGRVYKRIHDMSLTHTDSFLKNETPIDLTDETSSQ